LQISRADVQSPWVWALIWKKQARQAR